MVFSVFGTNERRDVPGMGTVVDHICDLGNAEFGHLTQ